MSKLILSMDGLIIREMPVEKEVIRIGRRSTNDIQIADMGISGEHLLIRFVLNDAFLEDLDSTNGTQVNGKPIKKCVLRDADLIDIGKYRLKYLLEGDETSFGSKKADNVEFKSVTASGEAGDTSKKLAIAKDDDFLVGLSVAPPLTPSEERVLLHHDEAPILQTVTIRLLSGKNPGRLIPMNKERNLLKIAGHPIARIFRRQNGCFFLPEGSQDTLTINGKTQEKQKSYQLSHNDLVMMGEVEMEFLIQ